jgi:O-antigen/teichoic acid export membrane protein
VTSVRHWLVRLLSVVRPRSASDLTSAQGRSSERYRRVALTAASGVVARGTTIVAGFVCVPLAMRYLGAERYGMWLTVSSVSAMFLAADLGVSNAMVQPLAAVALETPQGAQRIVSSAFVVLSGISIALLLAFAVAYPFINWQATFNVSSPEAVLEAGPTAAVALCCLAGSITAGIATRINASFQEGAFNNFWQTAGNVLGVALLFAVTRLKAPLPVLVLTLSGVPLLATIMNGTSVLRRRSWLRPRVAYFDLKIARSILSQGRSFFGSFVGYGCLLGGANMVIAQVVGPQHVPEFGLPIRIFAVVGMAVSLVVDPLWPAYAEALRRRDEGWVAVATRRSIVLAFLIGAVGSAMVTVLGSWILKLWVGSLVTASFMVWAGLGTWSLLSCVGLALSALLWGVGAAKFEAGMRVSQVALALLLMVVFTPSFGVAGCAWALAASELARLLPSAAFVARSIRKLELRPNPAPDVPVVDSSTAFGG